MNAIIREIEKEFLRDDKDFVVGNTLKVTMEVVEGDKKRLQAFEGIVVKRKGTAPAVSGTSGRQHSDCGYVTGGW